MRRLETLIPPPLVAATLAFLMWLAAPAAARAGAPGSLRLGLALLIASLGGAMAAAGSVSFKRAGTTVNPLKPERSTALVTGGVYRATRNPMYLGMTLALAGFGTWLWWWPSLLGAAIFIGYITRFQIRPEERALGAKFGTDYQAYCERVRRWL